MDPITVAIGLVVKIGVLVDSHRQAGQEAQALQDRLRSLTVTLRQFQGASSPSEAVTSSIIRLEGTLTSVHVSVEDRLKTKGIFGSAKRFFKSTGTKEMFASASQEISQAALDVTTAAAADGIRTREAIMKLMAQNQELLTKALAAQANGGNVPTATSPMAASPGAVSYPEAVPASPVVVSYPQSEPSPPLAGSCGAPAPAPASASGASASSSRGSETPPASERGTELLGIGTRVRVRPGVDPRYGWGSVKPSSVGVIKSIDEDGDFVIDFPGYKGWVGAPSDMEEAADDGDSSPSLKVGSKVCVRPGTTPKYGMGPVTTSSVGVIKSIDEDGDFVIDFPEKSGWVGTPDDVEPSTSSAITSLSSFDVGAYVSVRNGVTPKYGWGRVKPSSVGVVTAISRSDELTIDFPEHSGWRGIPQDVEVVEGSSASMNPGCRVRVRRGVMPKYGMGPVTMSSVGVIKRIDGDGDFIIDFPEKSGWVGTPADVEPADEGTPAEASAAITPGARVRFRSSVTHPMYGWAGVSHASVGVVCSVSGDDCKVRFKEHPNLTVRTAELKVDDGKSDEPAGDPSSGGSDAGFAIGVRVRVRPGLKPSTGWGSAKASSVGPISKMRSDGKCVVDFPEHKGWIGKLAELEAVGGDSLGVGTRVRVRPGLEPSTGWGSAKASSVGPISEMRSDGKCVVDFPEHKGWIGKLAELEAF